MKITAQDIKDLLALRHSQDVFVPECKTGASSKGCVRMDAWAMRKSWSNFGTVGYEIKVSRQDFIGDKKWTSYLQYCSEFYFVCPPKIIMPDEVGDMAGLIWVSENGTRLYTKKKAPVRSIKPPEDVYVYILMWRAKITVEYNTKGRVDEWREWFAEKDEKKRLGYNVSNKIRQLVEKRIDNVEDENRRLKSENEHLLDVKKFAADLKINIYGWDVEKKIKEQVEKLSTAIPKEFISKIESVKSKCQELLEQIASNQTANVAAESKNAYSHSNISGFNNGNFEI
ncbi:MAG: MmcB family DNA repair protein [Candidatus Micrarchaeia archaeon]|jgi:ribosome-associated translation inhibitor RaiA